jgi:post-segregation antitoxin (ccd killing protein)
VVNNISKERITSISFYPEYGVNISSKTSVTTYKTIQHHKTDIWVNKQVELFSQETMSKQTVTNMREQAAYR